VRFDQWAQLQGADPAWLRSPRLDLAPVEIFSRISRLARHLDLARREAFTAHDVEAWEFDVLAALRRAGKPYQLSPGRLLRETLVTSGTMTNRVDRLTARDPHSHRAGAFAARRKNPGDSATHWPECSRDAG
jgi:DNA-binding MarR family transcriptional regulator